MLGGVLAVGMGDASWKLKVLLLLIPTVTYFLLLIGKTFPLNERVAAGVSYRDMLKEVDSLGIFIISWMIFADSPRVFAWSATPLSWGAIVAAVIGLGFGFYVGSLGRPMFVLMLIIMVPLATTELSIDSWVTELMGPAMGKWGGLVADLYVGNHRRVAFLVCGPHCESAHAAGDTSDLCVAGRDWIGNAFQSRRCRHDHHRGDHLRCGQDFFWPTTLGVVAEQFPRGGAMTLNGISGVGMLGVGVLGAMFLGNIQDNTVDAKLSAEAPAIHEAVAIEKQGLLGSYQSIDTDKVAELPAVDQNLVADVVISPRSPP